MDKKDLNYVKPILTPITELVGVPLLIFNALKRISKNEKIADTLENIIELSKTNADKLKSSSKVELKVFFDEYQEMNNFFHKYFNRYNDLNIEERIDYCLRKYKNEALKINTASNTLILEENFLKGAERTLTLYFLLKDKGLINEENHTTLEEEKPKPILLTLEDLMGKDNYNQLMDFLIKERLITKDKELITSKAKLIRHHCVLRDQNILKAKNDRDIIRAMENEYKTKFDQSIISNRFGTKITDEEQEEIHKLEELFPL